MKNKLQIFLSYAYEDREKVLDISQKLQEAGYQTWMDVQNLRPGQDWDYEIGIALDQSDIVLIFITKNSILKEGYLQKEIKSALTIARRRPEGSYYIVPVKLENVGVPENLKYIQWLEFYQNGGWDKLLETLQASEKRKTEETQLINRSIFDIEMPRKHIFVAMPFRDDLEDIYFYGIKVPVKLASFKCYRADRDSYVGDVLDQIKNKIKNAAAVIGLLDGQNPNVTLEIGYAWGRGIPTILLINDANQLPFDLQGQRCIVYNNIRNLEELLTHEINELMDQGIIRND